MRTSRQSLNELLPLKDRFVFFIGNSGTGNLSKKKKKLKEIFFMLMCFRENDFFPAIFTSFINTACVRESSRQTGF